MLKYFQEKGGFMKKTLLILFGALLIFQGSMTCSAAESTNIFTTLKNAIIKDVESTVQSTVTSAATKAINQVRLAQYKQQLEQKKQELAELEASKTNFIVKFFKKRKLNREIKDLEEQIKELES